jgi:large subunit ribosomal protein L15
MSILASLKTLRGSTHYRKRKGRGDGSGLGGTAGKGHKGQRARTGGRVRRGFEGGQTPLMRRLPKFGFSNKPFRTYYTVINLAQLNDFNGAVTPKELKEAGLLEYDLVKILGNGELKKALQVKAHKFSASAKAAIEAAGGKIEVLE